MPATATRVPSDPTDVSFNPAPSANGDGTRRSRGRTAHPYVAAVVHPDQHLVTVIGGGVTAAEAESRGKQHLVERGADPANLQPGFEIHVKPAADMKALRSTHSASRRNRSNNGSDRRRKYLPKSESAELLNALKGTNITVDDLIRMAKERAAQASA